MHADSPPGSPAVDEVDHVVVGAGLGGLAAAAYLARAGRSVLLLDRHAQPGGLARTLRVDGYAVSHCPFLLWGAVPGGWTHELFTELDIADAVPTVPLDPLSHVYLPGGEVVALPSGTAVVDALSRRYPDQAGGIARFYATCDHLVDQWRACGPDLSALPPGGDLAAAATATLSQMLDRYVSGTELRTLIGSSWAHWGLPPSQVSGLLAALLIGLGQRGLVTLSGGPSRLADALLSDARRHGARVLLGTAATEIELERGRVTAVRWDGGRIRTNSVISNAPAAQTLLGLVGRDRLPAGVARSLTTAMPSMSAFQVYLGTDLDLSAMPGLAGENTVLADVDQDVLFHRAIRGDMQASFTVFAASVVDPTAAPPGRGCVKILGAGPARRRGLDWDRDAPRLAAEMIRAAEAVIPELSEHVLWRRWSTPADLAAITGSPTGSIYGWSATPEQIGPGRMARRTDVPGLWLAGAWTGPFAGMDLCLLSGRATAQAVLAETASARPRALIGARR